MLTLPRFLCVAALGVIGATGAGTESSWVVTGDKVCLRARADGASEVVWQVSSGAILQGVGGTSNWVEVLPPAEASVWVSASLVSNGLVQGTKVNLRAGPGASYPVVGFARQHEKVEVRATEYGWTRIRPTPECRLWISSDYVRPAAPAQAEVRKGPAAPPDTPVAARPSPPVASPAPVAAPPEAGVKAPASPAPVVPAPPARPGPRAEESRPAAATVVAAKEIPAVPSVTNTPSKAPVELPAGLRKYEPETDADQGRQALYRGVVDKCNWLWRKPASHRLLVRHPRRGVMTLCYVSGDASLLAPMEGKRVAVSGREYRLKGIDRPVVVYETLIEEAGSLTGDGEGSIIQQDQR